MTEKGEPTKIDLPVPSDPPRRADGRKIDIKASVEKVIINRNLEQMTNDR